MNVTGVTDVTSRSESERARRILVGLSTEPSDTIKLLAILPVLRADSCSHVSLRTARRAPRMDMLLAAVRVCTVDWVGASDWDGCLWQCAQKRAQHGDSLSNPRRQHPPRAGKQPQHGPACVGAAIRSGEAGEAAEARGATTRALWSGRCGLLASRRALTKSLPRDQASSSQRRCGVMALSEACSCSAAGATTAARGLLRSGNHAQRNLHARA